MGIIDVDREVYSLMDILLRLQRSGATPSVCVALFINILSL